MQERETRKCRSGTGIVMAFLAGAGVVTAAFMLARRFRETGTFLSIDGIIDRCDEAASKLDDRLGDVDIALSRASNDHVNRTRPDDVARGACPRCGFPNAGQLCLSCRRTLRGESSAFMPSPAFLDFALMTFAVLALLALVLWPTLRAAEAKREAMDSTVPLSQQRRTMPFR